jgi:hypothetical protein
MDWDRTKEAIEQSARAAAHPGESTSIRWGTRMDAPASCEIEWMKDDGSSVWAGYAGSPEALGAPITIQIELHAEARKNGLP